MINLVMFDISVYHYNFIYSLWM